MIGIRCDANSIIASGHMMRCLTVAKELVRLGESVTFFVADEESKKAFDKMAASEMSVVVLGSDWQNMEAELPVLGKELSANAIDILLVDSYYATCAYFERAKELCPVACFDDLHEDTYPVDILINYSGFYKELGYEDAYKDVTGHNGRPTQLLLGLQYAPLREQFYRAEQQPEHDDAASVLLASGGADTYGMLLAILEEAVVQGLMDINWHVVVGALCRDSDAIDVFAADHPSVHIYKAVSDMARLMRQSDLAICAAGTMLTECAATELPAIFYQVADNQKFNVEFFGNIDGMIFAGDVNASKDAVIQNICDKVKALLTGEGELSRMKSALVGLTDGKGAIRIAQALLGKL